VGKGIKPGILHTLPGVILGKRKFGEADSFLDVLTDEFGVVEVFAKGLRKPGAKYAGACELFSYSALCLRKSDWRYALNSAEQRHSFPGITDNLQSFALACYVCEVLKSCLPAEQPEPGIVRFAAVTLYEIALRRIEAEQIRGVFQLRFAAMLGYPPETDSDSPLGGGKLTETARRIIAYTQTAKLSALYRFSADTDWRYMAQLSGGYLSHVAEKHWKTLEYYLNSHE
jgi:recombinational DNA repair protein (RecF pathway)